MAKPLYAGPDNPNVDRYLSALNNAKKQPEKMTGKPVIERTPSPTGGNTGAQPPATGSAAAAIKGPVDPISGLPTAQRNAYTSLQDMLNQFGLGTLAPKLLGFVKQGYTSDSLNYVLQQTPEFKQRFAANDARIKNGLAPLAPADYLATERSYRDVLRASGLPAGFYDQPQDFQTLIGSDISPTELKARADDAFQFAQNNVDPNVKAAFQQYYGVNDGHLAAHFLDPTVGDAIIAKQVSAAQIGGTLKTAGVNVDQTHAEHYADLGVTQAQAQNGAQTAGLIKDDALNAASRFNTQFGQNDLADATVGGLSSAQRALKTLSNSEQALFAGGGGSPGQLSSNAGGGY